MIPARSRSLLLVAALLLGACDRDAPDKPSQAPPPRPPALSAAPASAAPAPPPPPLSATAPAPAGVDAIAGTWVTTYDAKKGSLGLPPKVKDPGGGDDGKTAVGSGKIEVTITATGDVQGKGTGALGASTLTGRAEGGTLRATLLPDDPRAPNAMTGVLIGLLKGDVIRGEIHVAGPDGTMVREAQVELKKKP